MNMSNNIFQEIEQLHSEWSQQKLVSKVGFLVGREQRLLSLANEMTQVRALRGYYTQEEMVYVRFLEDMLNELQRQKAEVNREIGNELRKEILKALMGLL